MAGYDLNELPVLANSELVGLFNSSHTLQFQTRADLHLENPRTARFRKVWEVGCADLPRSMRETTLSFLDSQCVP
jgi:hypothetical protein